MEVRDGIARGDLTEACIAAALDTYTRKESEINATAVLERTAGHNFPDMRELERIFMLQVVDDYWMDHIDAMDDLKQGIRLQGYGNNNPVDVYKRESLSMFEDMISSIQDETVRRLFSVRIERKQPIERKKVAKDMVENVGGDGTTPKKKPVRSVKKPGRNELCPCGSGKKFKKCTCREYHPELYGGQ